MDHHVGGQRVLTREDVQLAAFRVVADHLVFEIEEALDVRKQGCQEDIPCSVPLYLLILNELAAALSFKLDLDIDGGLRRKRSLHLTVTRHILKSNGAPYLRVERHPVRTSKLCSVW